MPPFVLYLHLPDHTPVFEAPPFSVTCLFISLCVDLCASLMSSSSLDSYGLSLVELMLNWPSQYAFPGTVPECYCTYIQDTLGQVDSPVMGQMSKDTCSVTNHLISWSDKNAGQN